jgi:hypothetical protein
MIYGYARVSIGTQDLTSQRVSRKIRDFFQPSEPLARGADLLWETENSRTPRLNIEIFQA